MNEQTNKGKNDTKKLIVIFTYKYPFSPPTEQFLDMELPYLKNPHVDVLIIPVSREIKTNQMYNTPIQIGARVAPLKRKGKTKEILTALLRTPCYIRSLFDDYKRILETVPKVDRKFALKLTLQQYIQAEGMYQAIKVQFGEQLRNGYNKIVLYSYWLDASSLCIVYLKEYLKKYNMDVVAISRAHGAGDLYQGNLTDYRPAERLIEKGLDSIYPISKSACKHLAKQGIDNTELARLGVPASGIQIECIKEKLVPVIVSCSVIDDNKRVGKIAEIISKIKNESVTWVHFGGGEKENVVMKWCKENMPSNVRWEICGTTSHDEIMKYYSAYSPDLFINMSKVEGIPVSIMEAFSYAIPCIATNAGAVTEIVEDQKNGFLFPIKCNSDQVSGVISHYLKMRQDEKKRFRTAAFMTWQKTYNSQNTFKRFSEKIASK